MPTFKSLFEENRDSLKLEWLAGRSSSDKALDTPANAGLASADLVGHLNLIHPNRLHVLGRPEVHYYLKLEASRRTKNSFPPRRARGCRSSGRRSPPPRSSRSSGSTSRSCSRRTARCTAC